MIETSRRNICASWIATSDKHPWNRRCSSESHPAFQLNLATGWNLSRKRDEKYFTIQKFILQLVSVYGIVTYRGMWEKIGERVNSTKRKKNNWILHRGNIYGLCAHLTTTIVVRYFVIFRTSTGKKQFWRLLIGHRRLDNFLRYLCAWLRVSFVNK